MPGPTHVGPQLTCTADQGGSVTGSQERWDYLPLWEGARSDFPDQLSVWERSWETAGIGTEGTPAIRKTKAIRNSRKK